VFQLLAPAVFHVEHIKNKNLRVSSLADSFSLLAIFAVLGRFSDFPNVKTAASLASSGPEFMDRNELRPAPRNIPETTLIAQFDPVPEFLRARALNRSPATSAFDAAPSAPCR
jgi:ABC-type uncharacterized transport system involved in gliding motility auxiliary subunit